MKKILLVLILGLFIQGCTLTNVRTPINDREVVGLKKTVGF